MTIRNATQRNAMATAYGVAAPYGGLANGDPGTSDSAATEIAGGSPAYTRKALNWGAAASSAIVSGATVFDVQSGDTVDYFMVCNTITVAASTVRDSVAVTSQTFSSQGTYTITATYTQT